MLLLLLLLQTLQIGNTSYKYRVQIFGMIFEVCARLNEDKLSFNKRRKEMKW